MDHIRIVLVRTYTAGNIGAASRAMKNMGLQNLLLVSPACAFPNEEATKIATSGAESILHNATIVDSLYSAVHDCKLVIACSAQSRRFDLPVLSIEQAAQKLYSTAITTSNNNNNNNNENGTTTKEGETAAEKVAIVFGPERDGLSNDDMKLAHYRVTIPTAPEKTSLNLAAAVQIISYELNKYRVCHRAGTSISGCKNSNSNNSDDNRELPSIAKREHFYAALDQVLQESGMAHKENPRHLMQKMRRIMDRAEPDDSELNLLRGTLATIQHRLK